MWGKGWDAWTHGRMEAKVVKAVIIGWEWGPRPAVCRPRSVEVSESVLSPRLGTRKTIYDSFNSRRPPTQTLSQTRAILRNFKVYLSVYEDPIYVRKTIGNAIE